MKQQGNHKNTTFRTFLLNYMLLVAVVSIAFYPIYITALDGLQENTIMDNRAILNNKVTILDNQILYLQNIAFSLRNNTNFSYLSKVKRSDIPIPYYTYLRSANEHMYNVMFQPDIADKIFFVYRNNPILISKNHATDDINRTYAQFLNFENLSIDAWNEYLQYENDPLFKPELTIFPDNSKIVPSSGLGVGVIAYIVPTKSYSANGLSRSDSALISLINISKLQKLLYEENRNYKYLCLIDKNNNVLHNFGEGEITELAELKEQKLTLIYSDRASSGIMLVAAIKQGMFSHQNRLVAIPATMFFVASVLIGVLFSFYLSYRNNIPIKKMQRILQSIQLSPDGQSVGNFNKMLFDLNSIKQRNHEQLFKLEEMTQMSLFDKLVYQNVFNENEIAMIHHHLYFLQQPFVVAVIKLDENTFQDVDESTDIYSQTLGIVFTEIASKILSNVQYVHNILGKKLVILISVQPTDNWRESIDIELQAICNSIKQTIAQEVMIGVSDIGIGYEKVCDCYEQAWCTLRLNFSPKMSRTVFYQASAIEECDLQISEVQKLYNLILAGNVVDSEKMIFEVYQRLLSLPSINERVLSRFYYSIQNILFFALNTLPNEVEFSFNNLSYSTELTVRELFDGLKFNASSLCNAFSQHKKGNHSKEQFEEYIAAHYSNCNLSAGMMAEHFNLSEKYLFALFRGIFGKSIGEYIEQVRMNHAMALLRESEMTISQISLRCGFYSTNTFSKAFKRYAAVSPGKWRSNQAFEDNT